MRSGSTPGPRRATIRSTRSASRSSSTRFSAPYLQGTEIDFLDGLQGGFAINNPNVSSACGCGHSFQVEEGAEGEMPSADAGCGSGCG